MIAGLEVSALAFRPQLRRSTTQSTVPARELERGLGGNRRVQQPHQPVRRTALVGRIEILMMPEAYLYPRFFQRFPDSPARIVIGAGTGGTMKRE